MAALAEQRLRLVAVRVGLSGPLLLLRGALLVVVVWFVVARLTNNPALLPDPLAVTRAWGGLARSGLLAQDLGASAARVAVGYAAAVMVGIPVGIGLTRYRPFADLVDPVVELTRPVAGIAWIPLALLVLGVGQPLTVFIVFHAAVYPLILNTASGLRRVDREQVAAARTLGVGEVSLFTQVLWPGALPSLFTGARVAMGAAWASVVAAEILGAGNGLGFAIEWYEGLGMPSRMLAAVISVSLAGFLCDALLRALERTCLPWLRSGDGSR